VDLPVNGPTRGASAVRPRWLTMATHVSADGTGGGMIRYVVELVRAMACRDDVELSVLAHPRSREFFADLLGDAGRVHLVPDLPVALVSGVERYAMARLVRGYDVVHGTKHLVPARLPSWRSRRGRSRLLLTVHDMLPLDRPRDFGAVKRSLIREPYLASIRAADAVACVSAATRDRLLSYVPSAADRAAVVPLAADGGLLRIPARPVRRLAGVPFALVVGDDSPRKNLGLLLEAIEAVRTRLPDAVLAVAGPPNWGVTADGELMRRLVDDGVVVQLGFVADDELRWCYANARVVCCPSLLEGFGLPALEALQLGAPLLTSDDPALSEVTGPGVPHLSSWDPRAWVEPLVARLAGDGDPVAASRSGGADGAGNPLLARTWDDVAADTLAVARA
jgi:glycosyltransferase involved in cell wall biosynthesis